METTDRLDEVMRYLPWTVAAVALVAVPVGVTRGAPAVVLWVAFALLASAVLLFWEALRAALDPTAPGDLDDVDDEGVPADLDARKRVALQALRDIEFERSIGRLSEDDYKALEVKYREEARAAMKAIDEGLGPWLSRADEMLKRAEQGAVAYREAPEDEPKTETAKDEPKAETVENAPVQRACPKCETVNDPDAVFCKKCATRVAAEAADAT